MPFAPGQGGRKPGALNKRTSLNSSLKQWFIDKSVHPMDMINEFIREQKRLIDQMDSPKERADTYDKMTKNLISLMPYIIPKIKDVEDDGQAIDVTPQLQESIKAQSTEDLIRIIHSIDNKD